MSYGIKINDDNTFTITSRLCYWPERRVSEEELIERVNSLPILQYLLTGQKIYFLGGGTGKKILHGVLDRHETLWYHTRWIGKDPTREIKYKESLMCRIAGEKDYAYIDLLRYGNGGICTYAPTKKELDRNSGYKITLREKKVVVHNYWTNEIDITYRPEVVLYCRKYKDSEYDKDRKLVLYGYRHKFLGAFRCEVDSYTVEELKECPSPEELDKLNAPVLSIRSDIDNIL